MVVEGGVSSRELSVGEGEVLLLVRELLVVEGSVSLLLLREGLGTVVEDTLQVASAGSR